MKRFLILSIYISVITVFVSGNDGRYFTRGGVIYPTNESKISLDREILTFSVQEKTCNVDILFEFNNPDNVDRKLLIGFQAPTASGDISPEIYNINQISDFKIISNGQLLPYTVKAAERKNGEFGELKEPKDVRFSIENHGVFVFLFDFTFKPGKNQINHSYSFPASSNVLFNQIYNYILTTGSKWADETIKNLTVQFDLGKNKYFYVNDVFGKNANWSIIGSGKVTNKKIDFIKESSGRMIRILSGKLQIDAKDFKPTENIEFGIISEDFFDFPFRFGHKNINIVNLKINDDKNYSKDELKILRNMIYAQYGYVFKNKELRDYFSQFDWYMPDPNLAMEKIELTEKEKSFINEIIKREKEL